MLPRIGLPVIRALADGVEVREPVGGGTEVLMEFATVPRAAALERPVARGQRRVHAPIAHARAGKRPRDGGHAMPSLARTVLPRLWPASPHAPTSPPTGSPTFSWLPTLSRRAPRVDPHDSPRRRPGRAAPLELRVGPLRAGQATRFCWTPPSTAWVPWSRGSATVTRCPLRAPQRCCATIGKRRWRCHARYAAAAAGGMRPPRAETTLAKIRAPVPGGLTGRSVGRPACLLPAWLDCKPLSQNLASGPFRGRAPFDDRR